MHRPTIRYIAFLALMIGLALVAAACTTPAAPPTPTATADMRPTATPAAIGVPPVTPTPQPTATLTDGAKAERLDELMRTNGGCELPCWWGIVPSETLHESAREDLEAMGGSWLWDNHASVGVDWGMVINLEPNDGVVQALEIGSTHTLNVTDRDLYMRGWQRYSLAEVLNRHGPPTQVLVYSPFRADPGGGPAYHLLVFYDDLGIEIEYTGSAEQLDGNHYRACPDLADIWHIGLFLYRPGQVYNVMERVLPSDSIDYITGSATVYDLISWEQAVGTSLEAFHQTFSKLTEEPCFEFESKWP